MSIRATVARALEAGLVAAAQSTAQQAVQRAGTLAALPRDVAALKERVDQLETRRARTKKGRSA